MVSFILVCLFGKHLNKQGEEVMKENYFFVFLTKKKFYGTFLNFFRLKKIYKNKKRGYTNDLYFPQLNHFIKLKQFETIIEQPLMNGEVGMYVFYYCRGRASSSITMEAKFDLIGCPGLKAIRNCSFREFIELYGKKI